MYFICSVDEIESKLLSLPDGAFYIRKRLFLWDYHCRD